MAVIRCLMMQKDEAALLEPWILWHGAIFGLENLTVLDNGSSDPHVLAILDRYAAKGVEILRQYDKQSDFRHKGAIFTDIITRWDEEQRCDFSLPLDCDEFLGVFLDKFSVDPAVIRAQFDLLMDEEATLITDRMLLNVPDAPDYYRPQLVRRSLFRADTIQGLDRGFHNPQTIYHTRWVRTPFVHIHLHNRPDYEEIRRRARQKLAHLPEERLGKLDDDDPRDGYHLHYYFTTSREEFAAAYRNAPNLYSPLVSDRFRQLGIDPAPLLGTGEKTRPPLHPPTGFLLHRTSADGARHEYVLFDPLYYAYMNEDVAQDASFGIWPLVHFLTRGWAENRPAHATAPPLVILRTPGES